MFRLAYKNVKHNPKRLALTILAVTLGVMLVTAIHTLTNSFDTGITSQVAEGYDGPDVSVSAEYASEYSLTRSPFGDDVIATITATDGVAGVVPSVESFVTILSSTGEIVPPAQMDMVASWSGDEVEASTITEGAAPTGPGEIMLGKDFAQVRGYAVGDMVTVAGFESTSQLRLTGVYVPAGASTFGPTPPAYTLIDDARTVAGFDGGYTDAAVTVADGTDATLVAEALRAKVPDDVEAQSAQEVIDQTVTEVREALKFVDYFTLAFALIAVYVGAFIIANTFRILVTQRTREIGLLRAIGARGSDIKRQVLLEATLVAFIATLLGIALGYGLATGMLALFSVINPDFKSGGAPTLPLDAVLWATAIGFGVTILSALLPAIHASSISPMDALRESTTQVRKPLRTRNIVGAAATLLGAGAIVAGLWADVPRPVVWVAVGVVFVIQGVTLLTAQMLIPIARGLRGLLGAWFGVDGKLAAGNVEREPRRAGTTAAALMIGVMLLAMVATLVESTRAFAQETVAGQLKSDYLVQSDFMAGFPAPIPDDALAAVRAVPGVEVVSPFGITTVTWKGNDYGVASIEMGTAEVTYNYDSEPSMDEIGDGVFIGPSIQDLGAKVGDVLTIEGATQTLELTVTGLYNLEDSTVFYVNTATGKLLDENIPTIQAMVNISPDADPEDTKVAIDKSLDEWPLLEVQEPSELVSLVNTIVDTILTIVSVMLSASLLVAILGVANTLVLSVMERTREIGLIRAVGARRKSVRRMITLESVAIALFGAVLGIVLGVAFGSAIVWALKDLVGYTSVVIPWMWMGIYAVIAIIAGILAAVWPAWRASRLNILDAIAADG